MSEEPVMASSFKNELTKKRAIIQLQTFIHLDGSIMAKAWWAHLTDFILKKYKIRLHKLGLYKAVWAIQYGITNNPAQFFFALLKMYNPIFRYFLYAQQRTWHRAPRNMDGARITDGRLSL